MRLLMPNSKTHSAGPAACKETAKLLPFYLNQSLSQEEARQLETHLTACEVCREEEHNTRAAWALYDGHLPVELLLDYALETPMSTGRRTVIESHLEACLSCSQELAAVRLEETIPSDPATTEPATRRQTSESRWRTLAWAASLAAMVTSGGWIWTLSQLAEQHGPSLPAIRTNLSVVELLPTTRDLARGTASDTAIPPVELPTGSDELVLVLLSGGRSCPSGCALEIYDAGQETPHSRIDALKPSPDGHLTLALPADGLPAGRTRLAVREQASGELVAEFWIAIPPSD